MRKSDTCVKCGCATIVRQAMIVCGPTGQEQQVNLRVDADPSAMVFKQAVRSGLQADICTECGYTEFYADDPKRLHRAVLEAQKNKPVTG